MLTLFCVSLSSSPVLYAISTRQEEPTRQEELQKGKMEAGRAESGKLEPERAKKREAPNSHVHSRSRYASGQRVHEGERAHWRCLYAYLLIYGSIYTPSKPYTMFFGARSQGMLFTVTN